MIGPYENEEELLKCMLYWQKRALEAEQWLEESLDANEEYVDIILAERDAKEYYKQQFLDKDKELQEVIDYFMIQLGRKEVAIRYLKDEL
jgi:hypothetical protein